MFNIYKYSLDLNGEKLEVEIGKVAFQSSGSLFIKYRDTVLLVNALYRQSSEKRDFLPLLVEYREQTYAAGKIPGGFYKREGKPRDKEILYSRAIDRALRPHFPKGMTDEVEIIAYLVSYDMETEPHFIGIIGASLALGISPIPFEGPVSAVRIGYINGNFVLNPTNSDVEKSDFDLLVAGVDEGICMIELMGRQIPEKLLLDAFEYALPYIRKINDFQRDIMEKHSKIKFQPTVLEVEPDLKNRVIELAFEDLKHAMGIGDKIERKEFVEAVFQDVLNKLGEEYVEKEVEIRSIFEELMRKIMRERVIRDKIRIDGRGPEQIRPVSCEVGLLPRVHGSALFTRGLTQALVVTTLGTIQEAQRLSELDPEEAKRFMLHYNFPPFSTGELKPLRGISRREIGHGALAEKAVMSVLPSEDKFPYTIRVVSDILSSNGSTSMASVCGASLSLMDAGVPIERHVAGISIGLVMEDEDYVLLTDIIGDEDRFGDMDFKVAGTEKGITAIQLDLKRKYLPFKIVKEALERAKETRLKLIDIMSKVIDKPRSELSKYAPKVVAMDVPLDKIGDIIGPGGKVIRKIIDATDVKIDIDDEAGKVAIYGQDKEKIMEAKKMIEEIIKDVEIGGIYRGKVVRLAPFGAFVVVKGRIGLVHISELDKNPAKKVEEIVKIGDEIWVKVLDIDEYGRLKLSRKQAIEEVEKRS